MTARLIFDDVISGLSRIQPFSVRCVTSSPPYWGRAQYTDDSREIGAGTLAQYIEDTVMVFRHMQNVLAADAVVWWNVGDTAVGSGGAGGDHAKGSSRENKSKYRQGDAGKLRDVHPGDLGEEAEPGIEAEREDGEVPAVLEALPVARFEEPAERSGLDHRDRLVRDDGSFHARHRARGDLVLLRAPLEELGEEPEVRGRGPGLGPLEDGRDESFDVRLRDRSERRRRSLAAFG